MIYKHNNFIYRFIKKRSEGIKGQEGFTLVEVMVALLIISIITVGLVQGTRFSLNTLEVNKEKTRAIALANEKIELIKTLNYDDIKLQSEDPEWPEPGTYPMLYESGYDIEYRITEVTDEDTESAYKQLKISVSKKPPMKAPVKVVTQIYPLGQGGQSSQDITPPAKPNGLIATATGPSSINLNWNDNTEDDIEGYKIYRSTTGGFTPAGDNFVIKITNSEYTDIGPGLEPDTTYYYKVIAVDTSGNESEPSEEANATTGAPDTTPPAAPKDLTATAAGSDKIALNWSNNIETDLAYYEVYRSKTSGFTPGSDNFVIQVTASEYTDTGLTPSTKYYYRVKAVDTSGNKSQSSVEVNATTLREYTLINLPFAYDGKGEYYWMTDQFSTDPNDWTHYVNSWNTKLVDINGVDCTNTYKFQHDIPAIEGWWYIHYNATSANGHIEIK
jgi:prepilin-type N-terminal cleavage/methylation domain-containing protein